MSSAFLPWQFACRPGLAALGLPVLLHGEAGEVVGVRVGPEDDRPAVAAVAAVRAALGDVLLPPERRGPAAAVPALHVTVRRDRRTWFSGGKAAALCQLAQSSVAIHAHDLATVRPFYIRSTVRMPSRSSACLMTRPTRSTSNRRLSFSSGVSAFSTGQFSKKPLKHFARSHRYAGDQVRQVLRRGRFDRLREAEQLQRECPLRRRAR